MMFQKDDLIVYGNTGVCRVKDIGPLKGISAARKDRIYYTLEPVYEHGTIYIPVDTKVFMRLIISSEEAQSLIGKIPKIKEKSVECQNQRVLSEQYEASLNSHNCEDLIQLIRTVYMRSQRAVVRGKKPPQTDERYMKRAKELLHGELAAALGINYEDVEQYIRDALKVQSSVKAAKKEDAESNNI